MVKKFVKMLLVGFLKLVPLDTALWASQRISFVIAGLIFFRDWKLQAYGVPQFFKHRINLGSWVADPTQWPFVARGVFARADMFKGCKVLDLCCGDGFYSYFFFSDIAEKVDAVDNDVLALSYAKRYHASSVIEYHKINMVEQLLPDGPYDFVVWNAAICYFTGSQIRGILKEVVRVGKDSVVLCGMAPKASGYPDHKTEFLTSESLKAVLLEYFSFVSIQEAKEPAPVFYFRAQGLRF